LLALYAGDDKRTMDDRRWTMEAIVHRLSSIVHRLSLVTLLWTYVAMLTGSAVVGTGTDLACPAWPYCADSHLLPTAVPEWVNFAHRIAVGFSDVLMLVLAIALWLTSRQARRLMRW